jgi:hypothetical protein
MTTRTRKTPQQTIQDAIDRQAVPLWTANPARTVSHIEVYRCMAYDESPYSAAVMFAHQGFDHPRQVEHDCVSVDGLFSLVDGRAVYAVVYVPQVRLVSPALYVITRYDPPAAD